jgi:hypothetical protein
MARATREQRGRMVETRKEHVMSMLASAGVAIWECDLTTGRVAWTGDLQAMFGRPTGEFATL